MPPAVPLTWLGAAPARSAGVTWGVPWARGELRRDDPLDLQDAEGRSQPVQSWPLAFWPDGSVKWSAHAAALDTAATGYVLRPGVPTLPSSPVTVRSGEQEVVIDTGALVCVLGRSGPDVIRSLRRDGHEVGGPAHLVCIREEAAETGQGRVVRQEPCLGMIDRVTVEQSGPVRAVVRIDGRQQERGRHWLPFRLRLYFYAGQAGVRLVHTLLYDGNPHQDFIRGIGLRCRVPLAGPLYNRHVRLAGDSGFFAESPKHLGTAFFGRYRDLYLQQQAGSPITFEPERDARFLEVLADSAVWDGYKLVQDSADHYAIAKRTGQDCSWVRAAHGRRAAGLACVAGEGGGLALGIRNFWQKHPTALEIQGMAGGAAELTAWLWSPDAPPMDLRHYDTRTHVRSSYEGFHELRATPYGVGNTSELLLLSAAGTPPAADLQAMAAQLQSPPLLVCPPQHLHTARALGVWSLPRRDTPARQAVEERLDELFAFYRDEVEQRRWYGFWDYGDVMHTYDPVRHVWRYDVGGYAWQNAELVPNIWLWLMFLRTGREDVFRLAEAMTRHTSEVDVYHLGEYQGLGSRHNVVHWGCGCKEARVSMAGLHRYYYYLTADERVGDILDEVADADFATARLDPMRAYHPKDEFPTHARTGPDWAAFCSAWLTRWERFEDTAYRDKILTGIASLAAMPWRLLTGPTCGYDPQTGRLHRMADENWQHHLILCMGAPQVWLEMAQVLQDPVWDEMLAEFGAFYNLTPDEKAAATGGAILGVDWSMPLVSAALAAFAARRRGDPALAHVAWGLLLESPLAQGLTLTLIQGPDVPRPVREAARLSTNVASQWSINAILCLELIGEYLDAAWAAR